MMLCNGSVGRPDGARPGQISSDPVTRRSNRCAKISNPVCMKGIAPKHHAVIRHFKNREDPTYLIA